MTSIQVNADYFQEIDTEQKAYWLGFLYADGYVAEKAPWTVILASIDHAHVEELAKELEYTGTIKTTHGKGYDNKKPQARLVICRKKMCDDLNQLGRNQETMTIPNIPKPLVRHFIRGYFDGDGSIYYAKSTAVTTAGNKKEYSYLHVQMIGEKPFLEEIAKLLLDEGITTYWKNSKTEYMKYLNISGGHNLRKLHKYLYEDSTIQLPRKTQKWEGLYTHSHGDM